VTGREKIEAAFSPAGAREAPAVICYERLCVRDHWDELTDCPWWYQFSGDLEHQLAWRRDTIARMPQDWLRLWTGPSRGQQDRTVIEERREGVFRVDRRTGEEERLTRPLVGGWNADGRSHHIAPPRLPESIEEVDASIPAAGGFDAGRFVAEGQGDLARALVDEFGGERFPLAHVLSPLWRCYTVWGFEGMMLTVADRPDLVRRACERNLAAGIYDVHEAAAMGAEGIWIEECLTDMVSPAAFEDLNVPPLRRLIEEIHSLGMKSIYYYCGDPAAKWKHILALGMDALSLEESKKDFRIDIEDIVERVGRRCTVLGNLNAVDVLQNGSEEQLRAEIARQIAAGRRNGGRFIMSLGSPVTPATPVGRIALYCDLVRELGG